MRRPKAGGGTTSRAGANATARRRVRPRGASLFHVKALLGVAFLVAVALLGGVAHAAGAQCTVTEILATNDKRGIDPRLARLKAKLANPPLTSFDTFKLVGERAVNLDRQKPVSMQLSYGQLTLLYKDKMSARGGKARLRFGVELDDHDGHRQVSTVVVFDSGDEVIIGGQRYQNGTYILALGCAAP